MSDTAIFQSQKRQSGLPVSFDARYGAMSYDNFSVLTPDLTTRRVLFFFYQQWKVE